MHVAFWFQSQRIMMTAAIVDMNLYKKVTLLLFKWSKEVKTIKFVTAHMGINYQFTENYISVYSRGDQKGAPTHDSESTKTESSSQVRLLCQSTMGNGTPLQPQLCKNSVHLFKYTQKKKEEEQSQFFQVI